MLLNQKAWAAFVVAPLIVSPNAFAFEVHGYKDIKFGMSIAELQASGFKCREWPGDDGVIHECKKPFTIGSATVGGIPVKEVRTGFDDDVRVNFITVDVAESKATVRAMLTHNFGEPLQAPRFERGPNSFELLWVGSNGASYSV